MSDVSKIAEPTPVGLASFAICLFCVACVWAGFGGTGTAGVLIPLLFSVALVHFLVGTFCFLKVELFTAMAFYTYGFFLLSLAIMDLGKALNWFTTDDNTLLIFFISFTIFTVIMWLCTLVTETALIMAFTELVAVFVLLDLSIILQNSAFVKYAGYVGIFCSFNVFYICAGMILGAMYGRSVLPMGSAMYKPSNTTNY
ncbi:Succinate-acetate/proton symporter SatP [Sporomusa silvacetica DSM 10669]|uniref:Succinate-acetate/proton symporter SatP n=1 Tax=Sporomusa silvacetica DSM 10669 TaxID=1123289 RepID=A0ABZ3IFU4_9FIRM|nr:acetate uptake transporter [Sporomusa silvacetica]OZC17022.1 succinate-acetate/proton symporter SatP [Sporomusa silvacetica DSM 10669]